jgi:hypothetical protein
MHTRILKKIVAALLLLPLLTRAQGTFIFDQQSSDESNPGNNGVFIQPREPMGQSFTPSLNAIGFVRFNLYDQVRNNGTGAVVYVNLRSDSITGPIIDSTAPVPLPDNLGSGLQGFVNFLFSGNVPLQPGVQYYLQPVVQSGDLWTAITGVFNYPGGDMYVDGASVNSSDLWFREGIIVPEPSTSALLVLAAGLWVQSRRSRKHAAQLSYARSSRNSQRKQGGCC